MAEQEISQDELQAALCSIYETEGFSDIGSNLLIAIDKGEVAIDPVVAAVGKLTWSWH